MSKKGRFVFDTNVIVSALLIKRSVARRVFTLFLSIFMVLGVVSCSVPGSQAETTDHFHLSILSWEKVAGRSTHLEDHWETFWPALQKAYPSGSIFDITENEIETYDWANQIITLTPNASKALFDAISCKDIDRTYQYPFCLDNKPFIVVLDGVSVYGGISSFPGSQRAFPAPISIVYFTQQSGIISATIFRRSDPAEIPTRNRPLGSPTIDTDALRDFRIKELFAQLRKLK